MQRDFWLERWRENQLGWHQPEVNQQLVRHWTRLGLAPGGRVFVPLCGRSRDMHWLAEAGFAVTGVELSEIALDGFFEGQAPAVEALASHRRYRAGAFELFAGDFFDLDASTLGPVDAVYDRAALIALPEEMRSRYVEHLDGLLEVGAQILLLTIEYDQAIVGGPPFSVSPEEVAERFAGAYRLEHVTRTETDDIPPKFAQSGIERVAESVHHLTKLR